MLKITSNYAIPTLHLQLIRYCYCFPVIRNFCCCLGCDQMQRTCSQRSPVCGLPWSPSLQAKHGGPVSVAGEILLTIQWSVPSPFLAGDVSKGRFRLQHFRHLVRTKNASLWIWILDHRFIYFNVVYRFKTFYRYKRGKGGRGADLEHWSVNNLCRKPFLNVILELDFFALSLSLSLSLFNVR